MPSESQRKFPKELHDWLVSLPSNTDFGHIAEHYGMHKGALLNLRVRLKAKNAKNTNLAGKDEVKR